MAQEKSIQQLKEMHVKRNGYIYSFWNSTCAGVNIRSWFAKQKKHHHHYKKSDAANYFLGNTCINFLRVYLV